MTVVVVVKDCESDGQGDVIVTKLRQGNVDKLPTWVQVVLNRLGFSDLQMRNSFRKVYTNMHKSKKASKISMHDANDACTCLKSYDPLEAGLLRTR